MRKFEKISKSEFLKDVPDANYDDIILPKRSTLNSAGYDFYSVISFTLSPGERRVIPTGIKASMNSNEFLSIYLIDLANRHLQILEHALKICLKHQLNYPTLISTHSLNQYNYFYAL